MPGSLIKKGLVTVDTNESFVYALKSLDREDGASGAIVRRGIASGRSAGTT